MAAVAPSAACLSLVLRLVLLHEFTSHELVQGPIHPEIWQHTLAFVRCHWSSFTTDTLCQSLGMWNIHLLSQILTFIVGTQGVGLLANLVNILREASTHLS
jgi:hypothetical protein